MHLRCWPYPWLSLSPQVVSYLVPLSFFFLLQQLATSSSDTLALSTIGLGNNWGYAPQLDSSQGNHLKLTVLFYPNVCLCKFKGQNVNYLWWQNVNKIWKGKFIPQNKYSKNNRWSNFFKQQKVFCYELIMLISKGGQWRNCPTQAYRQRYESWHDEQWM